MSHQLVGRRPIKLTTIINTEGKEVEVERREDPEEKALADKIVGLFIEAGYFQINHEISLFHKITSGMVWCLQSANYGFNTDSFAGFDEQTNIRNKIFLSEKIIRVLLSKTVKCPIVIQPHQILGLNVEHLFPLINWLVNHCLELQKHRRDDFVRIARQFLDTKNFSTPLSASDVRYLSLKHILDIYAPQRKFVWNYPKKLKQNAKFCKSEFQNVVYKNITNEERNPPILDYLIPIKADKCNVTSEELRSIHYDELTSELFIKNAHAKEENTKEQNRNIFTHIIKKQDVSQVAEDQLSEILKTTFDTNKTFKKVDTMINAVVKLESEYKSLLKTKEAKESKETISESPHSINRMSLDELYDIEKQIDRELSKLNEDINLHSKEEWSKGLEKQVFRERLNELQSQVIMTTVQTKQHYAHYNTLIDIQAYKNKEINLLNSVIENYERAKSAKNYQEQYLKQLENVAEWIKQTKSKLCVKHNIARGKRNDVHKQWSILMQMERDYAKVTRDIKLAVS